ncbi:hypothetical protein [Sporosarcina jiandibaonis]|uniref:hypothetical protein n=1 Tax=Sporosarcina jiandibaonis TaxID=2715535 RepID=UPI001554F110|nr:hypothetical protein [Sporosarcina jiandibaonis]
MLFSRFGLGIGRLRCALVVLEWVLVVCMCALVVSTKFAASIDGKVVQQSA